MNARKAVTNAHDFDPETGLCSRCQISEIEMRAMLQRLQGYKLLDAALSERRDAPDWTISQATRDLYAHLERARHCL